MSDEKTVEATPLKAGDLTINTQASERKELPNGTYFQARIDEVGVADFGEGERLEVKFTIFGGPDEFKDQNFKKWFNLKASGPKAGIVKLAFAAVGTQLTETFDPTVLIGKGVNVIFSEDTFEGRKIQVASYMPLSPEQKVPKAIGELTDTELESELDAIFDGKEA